MHDMRCTTSPPPADAVGQAVALHPRRPSDPCPPPQSCTIESMAVRERMRTPPSGEDLACAPALPLPHCAHALSFHPIRSSPLLSSRQLRRPRRTPSLTFTLAEAASRPQRALPQLPLFCAPNRLRAARHHRLTGSRQRAARSAPGDSRAHRRGSLVLPPAGPDRSVASRSSARVHMTSQGTRRHRDGEAFP